MLRYMAAIGALASCPGTAQSIVTLPVKLNDKTPATPEIVTVSVKATPHAKKGATIFPCAGGPQRRYNAGVPCHALPAAPASTPRIALPVITTTIESGASNGYAKRRSDLHQIRAMDGYVLAGNGITIRDVVLDSARYGVTMRRKDGSYGTVNGLTIQRVNITANESPIYIRGGSHEILIEDVRLTCTHTGSGIPAGIKVGAANSEPNYNITVRRALITGCTGTQGRYPQGDGFASERPDHDILIENSTFSDMGDGCIDTKSTAVRLVNVHVARCNYGLRAWGQGVATDLYVTDVRKAGIQMKPTTNWRIGYWHNALIGAAKDVVTDGAGGTLTIDRCDQPVVTGIAKSATVNLGVGCVAR